jgi:integrase/recombinase XerD
MKHLEVKTDTYKYLEQSFKQWLDILGYASITVYSMPNYIREFFNWLEQKNIMQLNNITAQHIKQYYDYIKQRGNTKESGALSASYINKHRQALSTFTEYIHQTGRYTIPYVKLDGLKPDTEKIQVLTTAEIKQLYEASYLPDGSSWDAEISIRDRAILSIVYGCGLRRNETVHLDINDIDLEKSIVHVRKGKGNKERLVPLNKSNVKYIEDYIYNARPYFTHGNKIEALFISIRRSRMNAMTINMRLRIMIQKTKNPVLIEKEPTLHTLRHSIATHLLNNGMKLEAIAKFLGHSSLESTQIYTHLAEEQEKSFAN